MGVFQAKIRHSSRRYSSANFDGMNQNHKGHLGVDFDNVAAVAAKFGLHAGHAQMAVLD